MRSLGVITRVILCTNILEDNVNGHRNILDTTIFWTQRYFVHRNILKDNVDGHRYWNILDTTIIWTQQYFGHNNNLGTTIFCTQQ